MTPTWLDGPTPLVRLRVRIENRMAWNVPGAARGEVVLHSLVAVHTLLAVTGGRFVSLLDPPEFARPVTESCENVGTYPVLAGTVSDPDDGAVVLSSPIILYDHPEVAPESPGDLFDSTEIDEILALRMLTLTDEEKREARATDTRVGRDLRSRRRHAARDVRSPPRRRALPGGSPGVSPSDVGAPGRPGARVRAGAVVGPGGRRRLRSGDRHRLDRRHPGRPGRRRSGCGPGPAADAHDMFLAGRAATVEAALHDVDDEVHVAVVLDDDPGADLFAWQGRFNYFLPDELEVLS